LTGNDGKCLIGPGFGDVAEGVRGDGVDGVERSVGSRVDFFHAGAGEGAGGSVSENSGCGGRDVGLAVCCAFL
jgi:hypothetical protein